MDLRSVISQLDQGKAYSAAEVTDKCDKLEAELAWRELDFCSYTVAHSLLLEKGVSGICQPAYSCLTCSSASGRPVGLCDACMIKCHVDHEIIECGERNQFRCDCPTSKCAKADGSFGCRAQPPGGPTAVQHENGTNAYDHNFQNKFCSCNADYDADADTMYQCCACNEWYHEDHLQGGVTLPSTEGTGGTALLCAPCVASKPYLRAFACYTPGVCFSPAAALPASASPSSPPDTHGTGAGTGARDYPIQVWRACLTCSAGQEDGLGVCMACAEACHVGHTLLPPRISAFQCDCTELLSRAETEHSGTRTGHRQLCACRPSTAAAAPTASVVAATPAPITTGKRPASAMEGNEGELACGPDTKKAKIEPANPSPVPTPTPVHSPVKRVSKWCSARVASTSTSPPSPVFVPGTCIMLDDLVPLIDELCTCDSCLYTYAHDGVLSWWVNDPEEDGCIIGEEDGGESSGTARGKWVLHPQWSSAVLAQAGPQAVRALLMGPQQAQRAAATAAAAEGGAAGEDTIAAPRLPPSSSGTGGSDVVYPAGYVPMLQRSNEALAALEPAQQIPLIQGFVDFKSAFAAFLEEKAQRVAESAQHGSSSSGDPVETGPDGKPVLVVTEADVKAFMAKFSAEQRQKRELELRGIR